MLTIVLSGPKSAEPQARTALAAAGFTVLSGGDSHGLTDTASGKATRQAVSFLTVEHEDINAAASCVASLKYVLRMHHEKPEPPGPTPEELLARQLADLRRDVDALREGR